MLCGKATEKAALPRLPRLPRSPRLPSREIVIMEIHGVFVTETSVFPPHCAASDQVRSEHLVSAVDLVLEQFQSDLRRRSLLGSDARRNDVIYHLVI